MEIKDIKDYIETNHNGKFLGFNITEDPHSGSLGWYDENDTDFEKVVIWATPNWDGKDNEVPFDISDSDGNYRNFTTLNIEPFSLKGQLKLYFSILALVIDSVNSAVQSS
jgi:hypothetical protein